MLKMDIQEIINAVNGNTYILMLSAYEYSVITTDTRKLVKGSIFVALKGDNFNGNNYHS